MAKSSIPWGTLIIVGVLGYAAYRIYEDVVANSAYTSTLGAGVQANAGYIGGQPVTSSGASLDSVIATYVGQVLERSLGSSGSGSSSPSSGGSGSDTTTAGPNASGGSQTLTLSSVASQLASLETQYASPGNTVAQRDAIHNAAETLRKAAAAQGLGTLVQGSAGYAVLQAGGTTY